MSPLNLEVYVPNKNEWVKFGEVKPGDQPGSMSNNTTTGREVILFECARDDSQSIIKRSKFGIDTDLTPQIRVVSPLEGFELLKTLRNGESFEMDFKSDNSPTPRKIRFTHKKT